MLRRFFDAVLDGIDGTLEHMAERELDPNAPRPAVSAGAALWRLRRWRGKVGPGYVVRST